MGRTIASLGGNTEEKVCLQSCLHCYMHASWRCKFSHFAQADGHCMYRAVQDQLEASDEDPGMDFQELRQETASYMRAFPDNFLPFINQVSC